MKISAKVAIILLTTLLPPAGFAEIKENNIKNVASNKQSFVGQSLVYCANGVLSSFNPQMTARGITPDILAPQIYNRLIISNANFTDFVPEIASSWQIHDNFTRYVFKLKPGIRFQETADFKPSRFLNADDVIFSFDRLINRKNPFYLTNQFPYFDAIDLKSRINTINKIDDLTVEFILNNPDIAFMSHIASYYSPILSAEYAAKLEIEGKLDFLDKAPVGTGAFQLENYLVDEYIRLKRNKSSWQIPDAKDALFQQIIIELSSSGVGRLSKLLSTECDILAYPAASQLPAIEKQHRLQKLERVAFGTAFLAFNTQKLPLSDPEIRKAIAYAINNPRLMQSIYQNTAETAGAFLPSDHWAFDPTITTTHYFPEQSKRILKDKAIEDFNLTLRVSSVPQPFNPSPIKMAELIQADLAQVGINVQIIVHDGYARPSFYDTHPVDMELTGWTAPNADPDTFLRPVLSCAAVTARVNNAHWCNQNFESFINQAIQTSDINLRKVYYQDAQKLLAEELPILPLAYTKNMLVHDRSIGNTNSLTQGNFSFYQLYRHKTDSKKFDE